MGRGLAPSPFRITTEKKGVKYGFGYKEDNHNHRSVDNDSRAHGHHRVPVVLRREAMEYAKKEGWGGKRSGAGRPKGTSTGRTRIYKKVNLAFLEEDYKAMRKLAEGSGKSFSRFIADSVLGREG